MKPERSSAQRVGYLAGSVVLAMLIAVARVSAQVDQGPASSARERILISASDKRGNAISVGKGELTLTFDKRAAEILELVPASSVPVDFVVLADISGSNRDKMGFEREAVRQIFEALGTGANRGYLGEFNDEMYMTTRPVQTTELTPLLDRMTPRGGTALFAAIIAGCERLAKTQDSPLRRRILLLISDGIDNASRARLEDAVRAAQLAGVSVFALQLDFPYPNRRGEQALKAITRQTGGHMLRVESASIALDRLLRPLSTQYFVEFTPPASIPRAVLSVELKAKDRSVQISAPSLYITR